MKTIMTGCYGRCGTAIIDHLHDSETYEFTYFNRSDRPDSHPYGHCDTVVGNVTEGDLLSSTVEGHEAMIHLAAYPYTEGTWSDVKEPNIQGAYNALEAAREHELDTVIFGSTNHVVGLYEDDLAPEIYRPGHGVAIDQEDPIRPDSYYGTTKAFGEALCRQYAECYEYPKHIYAIRICSVRMPEHDHPYGDAEKAVQAGEMERGSEEYELSVGRMKAMWHSRRDFAHQIECCLADDAVDFGIFAGVSDNDRRWFSLENARAELGYSPQDNGEEWDGPPE